MKLRLYNVTDGDNVINKVIPDTDFIELDIRLKRDVDISNPILILSGITGIDYNKYNYAQIVEFKRFYYIDSISNLSAKLSQLQLSCDVLETYKDEILSSRAKFKRNIRAGDYIDTADFDTSIVESVDIHKSNVILDGNESVILTTIGVGAPQISQ